MLWEFLKLMMQLPLSKQLTRLLKTAIVDLIELRIAKGMCGKSYMLLTGEVSAVEASIEKAKELVAEKGMYLDSSVIAHPDKTNDRQYLCNLQQNKEKGGKVNAGIRKTELDS